MFESFSWFSAYGKLVFLSYQVSNMGLLFNLWCFWHKQYIKRNCDFEG